MKRCIDVLVVDDSASDADVTLFALQCAAPNATTLWLKNGDLALQYLSAVGEYRDRGGGLPLLVLLKVELPIISGLSVLDVIRGRPPTNGIPVVMLSRSCDPLIFRRGDMFDADVYLAKSEDHEEYCAQIERLANRWLPTGFAPGRRRAARSSTHQTRHAPWASEYG